MKESKQSRKHLIPIGIYIRFDIALSAQSLCDLRVYITRVNLNLCSSHCPLTIFLSICTNKKSLQYEFVLVINLLDC